MEKVNTDHLVPEIVKNLVSRLATKNTNTNEYNMAIAQLTAVRDYVTAELEKKNIK